MTRPIKLPENYKRADLDHIPVCTKSGKYFRKGYGEEEHKEVKKHLNKNYKPMTQNVPLEEEEQKAFVQWLRAKKLFFFAPTNENNTYKQNSKYAMIAEQKAKAAGKLKGVSDLIIMLPNKILFIELKRRPKKLKSGKLSTAHTKLSKEQIVFLDKVNKYLYAKGYVAYGAKEAIEIVERNGGIR